MDNKIPVIHTLESDMTEFSKNEDSPVLAAQQQLENRIIPDITDTSGSKWKVLIRIVLVLIVLVVVGFAAYKLTVNKTAAPVAANKPVVTNKAKLFTVSNVWPSMADTLASSTGEATSTNTFVIITITNFNDVYESVTQNEDKISDLATKYFDISELSAFSAQQLNNVELHVSDGGDKPLIYGYVGQKYLIFTTSISDFFQIYDKLGGNNANKSS